MIGKMLDCQEDKARISIARAILKSPIILLDEATSSLMQTLKKLSKMH